MLESLTNSFPLKTEMMTKSNNKAREITMDDIKPLLQESINYTDDSIDLDYFRKDATKRMEMKLKRLNRGISPIYEKWPNATPLQLFIAFDLANCCTDDLMLKLDEEGFKENVNQTLKLKFRPNLSQPTTDPETDSEGEDEKDDDDGEFVLSFHAQAGEKKSKTKQPRERGQPKQSLAKNKTIDVIPPCPPEVSPSVWNKWSDVHRKSYLLGMKDPNAFLYRNPPIGVAHKTGPWTIEEKNAFLKRLKEVRGNKDTIDGKWGLFSMAIPGRVGYQCSNFYRQLILAGEVYDSKYFIGSDGKLHHKSHFHPDGKPASKGIGHKHIKSVIDPKSILSLKFVWNENNFSCFNKECASKTKSNKGSSISRYEKWAFLNPMPDAVDYITGEKIRVPAMSPDGYVLDYNTWISTLKTKPENPFTRNRLQKRDLIVLTTENFDDYKSQIVNIDQL